MAALTAGLLAFLVVQLVLGVMWGAGSAVLWLSTVALSVAAAFAALTMKRGLAVVYGILAAIWLLAEGLALLLACLTAGLS